MDRQEYGRRAKLIISRYLSGEIPELEARDQLAELLFYDSIFRKEASKLLVSTPWMRATWDLSDIMSEMRTYVLRRLRMPYPNAVYDFHYEDASFGGWVATHARYGALVIQSRAVRASKIEEKYRDSFRESYVESPSETEYPSDADQVIVKALDTMTLKRTPTYSCMLLRRRYDLPEPHGLEEQLSNEAKPLIDSLSSDWTTAKQLLTSSNPIIVTALSHLSANEMQFVESLPCQVVAAILLEALSSRKKIEKAHERHLANFSTV